MELRNLNTFKIVTEVRGITKAAEILGYAQSSVTAQIHALEEELGTPLFDRLGKRIVLTEAGHRLLPFALEIIKLHENAKSQVKADNEPTGTLSIGAPESLAAFRLPSILSEFKRRYPQVKIVLRPGLCSELRTLVRNGDLDMAFLLEPEAQEPDLHIETLMEERIALIAPLEHPLNQLPLVRPVDLVNEMILHTEPGCSYRGLFEKYLQASGIYSSSDLEFWSIEAIKNCVMSGLGISYLPLYSVEAEIVNGKFRSLPWDDTSVRVCTQFIYHKAKWITPAMREFSTLVRKHAQDW